MSSIAFRLGARAPANLHLPPHAPHTVVLSPHAFRIQRRSFTATRCHSQRHRKESFSSRLRTAWANTPIQWYPIPVGVGVGFLGFLQFQRVRAREQARIEQEEQRMAKEDEDAENNGRRPKKRPRIRPSGPWYAYASS
jgi:phosphatidylserine decarboxylase